MNTPSHILLHLGMRKYWNTKKDARIPRSFVLGAFAPDIGLYACVIFYMIYSQYYLGNSSEYTFQHMFDILYFEHPLWIFAYNLLHAPLMLVMFLGMIKIFQNYLGKYYKIVLWFIIGCMLHSLFDIPLHHNDGPRIFYPLSDYIYHSPISYWNQEYYAGYIIPLELGLCTSMVFYVFIFPKLRKTLGRK